MSGTVKSKCSDDRATEVAEKSKCNYFVLKVVMLANKLNRANQLKFCGTLLDGTIY